MKHDHAKPHRAWIHKRQVVTVPSALHPLLKRSAPRPLLMGVVNMTPDSTGGDGLDGDLDAGLSRARALLRDGADILDIGGESARTDREPVSIREEIDRVVPLVAHLKRHFSCPVSVDTYKEEVARTALQAGADMINSIGHAATIPGMAGMCGRHAAYLLIMHGRGVPKVNPGKQHYEDVVREVTAYLARCVRLACAQGCPRERIIVDPGLGFGGKSLRDDLALIRHIARFRALGCPVLFAPSNKDVISRVLCVENRDRSEGSMALVAWGVLQQVDIIRVHDVRSMWRIRHMLCSFADTSSCAG